jgi:hypothetical protein
MVYMSTSTSTRSKFILCMLLRYLGSVSLLALGAVVMPYRWMDATHRWLGMGPLPSAPIVGYLARSLSLFYALFGGLLWLLSLNPERYRAILVYVAASFVVFGLIMVGVDLSEGMPAFWPRGEGSIIIFFGGVILWHSLRLQSPGIPPSR